MIDVGIVVYIIECICLNILILVISVVKLVVFDNGDILLLNIVFVIIVFVVIFGGIFNWLLIEISVIFVVDVEFYVVLVVIDVIVFIKKVDIKK